MTGILTQKDIFNTIYKTPNFFSEFYGDNFSSNFKEVYERINQSRLELDRQFKTSFNSHSLVLSGTGFGSFLVFSIESWNS